MPVNWYGLDPNDADASHLFEKAVGELLSLAGYEVKRERVLGHKKVDLYIEEKRLGSRCRIAVECKCYNRVLTKRELTTIRVDYNPLYESNHIDEILVVTLNGLAPSAETVIDSSRIVSHVTYADLQNTIMDFRPYLLGLIDQYSSDGLSLYYVRLYTHKGLDVEDDILDWLKTESNQPIAILGSYGMGKTTLARRIAYLLAEEALRNENSRIPILLRVGEISSEQSVEGLLGKAFTSVTVVRNYNFNVFMKLNELGRFVIILDGFDEMKHTLSWGEFKYNLRQLNRLVVPNSKVILLGRPTAFITDYEYQFGLHGIRLLDEGQVIRDLEWPDYREIHLAHFNSEQVKSFLKNYLEYRSSISSSEKERQRLTKFANKQIDRVSEEQFSDIARRPVQLKMLAEVLPQWNKDISNLTITILYDLFIDVMIEREQEKIARRLFGIDKRRRFAGQLAKWLWTNKKEMSITAEDIPESILGTYDEGIGNVEGVRRDLVSACFLERKLGGSLYFPHRSFQEFLLAESIVEDLKSQEITISEADSLLTEEIASFVAGLVNVETLKKWKTDIDKYRGTLSIHFINVLMSDPQYFTYYRNRLLENDNPWFLLTLTIAAYFGKISAGEMSDFVLEIQKKGEVLYAFLCFLCISLLCSKIKSYDHMSSSLRLLCEHPTQWHIRDSDYVDKHKQREFIPDDLIVRFMSNMKHVRRNRLVDLKKIYSFLFQSLSNYCMISDWTKGDNIVINDFNLFLDVYLTESDARVINEYQEQFC